jgi:hypothetical protein
MNSKIGIPQKVPDVISASGEKIVYAENVISIIQQIVTEVTTDKTCSARYQDSCHVSSLLMSSLKIEEIL